MVFEDLGGRFVVHQVAFALARPGLAEATPNHSKRKSDAKARLPGSGTPDQKCDMLKNAVNRKQRSLAPYQMYSICPNTAECFYNAFVCSSLRNPHHPANWAHDVLDWFSMPWNVTAPTLSGGPRKKKMRIGPHVGKCCMNRTDIFVGLCVRMCVCV